MVIRICSSILIDSSATFHIFASIVLVFNIFVPLAFHLEKKVVPMIKPFFVSEIVTDCVHLLGGLSVCF